MKIPVASHPDSFRNPSSLPFQAPACGRFGVTDEVRFSISIWTCGQEVYKREPLEGRSAGKGIPKTVKTRRAKTRDCLRRGTTGTLGK